MLGILPRLTVDFRVHGGLAMADWALFFLAILLGHCSVSVVGTCPTGMYGQDCLSHCHCANNAACVRDSGYCSGSNGACADGYHSDMNANNCQTGIVELQMLTMPNLNQNGTFSCAATSGDVLQANLLVLAAGDPSTSFTRTDSVTEGKVLNNTFSASGLNDDQYVYCYLLHNGSLWTYVRVSLFVQPYLSQPPAVLAGLASVTVTWHPWGSYTTDSGDGPVVKYVVYFKRASVEWTVGGEVQVIGNTQPANSFVVQPLVTSTQYQFSVSAVRDGRGGEGPRSPASDWIYPLATLPSTTKGPVTESSTAVPSPSMTGGPVPTSTEQAPCPVGSYGLYCLNDCHCANNSACVRDSGYCSGSNGICHLGFTSDINMNNCQTGIIEFKMLKMPNQGQDVNFSCAATSGDVLLARSLFLYVASSRLAVLQSATSTEGSVLNNTFSVPGLSDGLLIGCYLTHNSRSVSVMLSVSFFVQPHLGQPPSVNAGPASVSVSWQAWGSHISDSGDGPIIKYVVYYNHANASVEWTVGGEVQVRDQSQVAYSLVVQPLVTGTQYQFSVSAVRDGRGGEGSTSPASAWIYPLATLPSTTENPTVMESWTTMFTQSMATLRASTSPEPGVQNLVVIVVCGVFACVILLIVATTVVCLCNNRRRTSKPGRTQAGGQELTAYERRISRKDDVCPSSGSALVPGAGSSTSYADIGLPYWAEDWNIPWGNIVFGQKALGGGYFSDVLDGAVKREGVFTKAAIKKLAGDASTNDTEIFMIELRALSQTGRHPNVVGILGACQHKDSLYVAVDYTPKGDLRSYLRKARSLWKDQPLLSEKLIQFALGVARGMQHLAATGVIHSDLSARNIRLANNAVPKVSDRGLSREEDINSYVTKARVPIRWLSLESLMEKSFTSKSNVWSFGIVLWEIATLDIRSENLLSRLENGYRMPKLSNCADELHNLMLKCWHMDPRNRPSFLELSSVLAVVKDKRVAVNYIRPLPTSEQQKYLIRPELDVN
ncbi:tyrosine-protein kinase receptor Tie-1-like isoform X3 [Acanthaster planci]|uniref:Tyrosine-protein kinase receptor Tie-1-like isoform X3 n=1 Tax=Acanthaster planci TaxID=133434 RepID=A0A8B7ZV32_ACAPL|nr:tyrosine-protein kinase receptor Tie-1-like isoform X3 [Acanthaster planci]